MTTTEDRMPDDPSRCECGGIIDPRLPPDPQPCTDPGTGEPSR